MRIKKCWINDRSTSRQILCTLSLESENTQLPIVVNEQFFPSSPTPEHPLRHTINLGILTEDDLLKIRDVINCYLNKISLIYIK